MNCRRQPLDFRLQDGVAMSRGGGRIEFFEPRGPIDMRDLEEFQCQLPPGGIVLCVQLIEIAPFDLGSLDFADQGDQLLGEPDGICRARRGNDRCAAVEIDDRFRKAVAPHGDQAGQFQCCGHGADRRQEVQHLRQAGLEESAIVIGFAQGADCRKNGRAVREKQRKFGAQHARRAPGGNENRHIGEHFRAVWIEREAFDDLALQDAFRQHAQKGGAGRNGENPFLPPRHPLASRDRETGNGCFRGRDGVRRADGDPMSGELQAEEPTGCNGLVETGIQPESSVR